MNALAIQENPQLAPRNAILLDCRTALAAVTAAHKGIASGETSLQQIRRLVQQLHALKGAASMVGLQHLSEDLHELEGGLTCILRQAPEVRGKVGELPGLESALARVAPKQVPSKPKKQLATFKPFGDALWWSSQMAQVTAKELGKRVFLMVRGGQVRIPESQFDILQTSLQHLTRNAVVHGIEMPETRILLGKPPLGLIRICARRLHNHVVVNVIDNGAGIPQSAGQDPFALGASSISGATPIAGRGIGLAAVKDACTAKGGTVSVRSVSGKGTAFTMRLPY